MGKFLRLYLPHVVVAVFSLGQRPVAAIAVILSGGTTSDRNFRWPLNVVKWILEFLSCDQDRLGHPVNETSVTR